MPRKRATKQKDNSRPSAKLSESQAGADLDLRTRQAKVLCLLRDFEAESQSRLQALKDKKRDIKAAIELAYTRELAKIPMEIRKMTVSEYAAKLEKENQQVTSDNDDSTFARAAQVLESHDKQKEANDATAALDVSGTVKKRTRTTKKKATVRIQDTTDEPPASSTRSRRKNLATPAVQNFDCNSLPAITPKCNLQQLQETEGRRPRASDFAFSIRGSLLNIKELKDAMQAFNDIAAVKPNERK